MSSALAVSLVVCCLALLCAQTPAFEVATIKENPGPVRIGHWPNLRNGTFLSSNITLKRVLGVAFGVTEVRIIGPDWLDSAYFDFMAKSPKGVPDSALQPMLQALLQDRFKLQFHREARETIVYYLVVAKGGLKMKPYPARERPRDDPNFRGFPAGGGRMTVSLLADMLARAVSRPVIDKTGLSGEYEFSLHWATPADNLPEFAPPDIFTAVQEQLGLKFDPGKDNLEVIVIDHMERMPTDN